jgi:phosphate/sulfate permease
MPLLRFTLDRIANLIAAVVIVLLVVNPARDLTPISAMLAVAVAMWYGPMVWRKINARK